MMIDAVTQNLKDIIARIDEAEGMARCLANEFFGPQPEKEPSPEISGGSTMSTITHLESRVGVLLHQLNRFLEVPRSAEAQVPMKRKSYAPPPTGEIESSLADLVHREVRRGQ